MLPYCICVIDKYCCIYVIFDDVWCACVAWLQDWNEIGWYLFEQVKLTMHFSGCRCAIYDPGNIRICRDSLLDDWFEHIMMYTASRMWAVVTNIRTWYLCRFLDRTKHDVPTINVACYFLIFFSSMNLQRQINHLRAQFCAKRTAFSAVVAGATCHCQLSNRLILRLLRFRFSSLLNSRWATSFAWYWLAL